MRLILLHSPLLGPLTWQGVAQGLTGRGLAAVAPAWTPLTDISGDFYATLAKTMARTIEDVGDDPVILVAHSGAGALAPATAQALSVPVIGTILVDAILPHPSLSWLDTAPPALRQDLTLGSQGGELPSWDAWWPPGALDRLVPDPALRASLLAELGPLPLAYFEEPAPPGALSGPGGYLQLSGAYEDQAQAARDMGWRVRRLQLNHLSPLTAPREVAGMIQALSREIAVDVHG
ncbi:hypothetical protein [Phenylobacterium sp.]|uniref:hypothetical protein n=1 Tax=Phenylobacterium sp. TaxID=1871053 RepID=UPI002730A3D4|nr:hypothetical protein [Phenylobacterium sp.]MDP1618337.1 hypothetical protein [Phenylobacterium sp.]MDP1988406.1 hypothetical protein [Phenylobacterium sp.]